MPNFRSTVESMLTNGETALQGKHLHQEVRAAQPIVGMALPHLDSIYMLSGWGRQTVSVRTGHTPDILCLKSSGKWFWTLRTKTQEEFFIPEQWPPTHDTTDCVHAMEILKLHTNAYNMALRILYVVNDTIVYSDTMFIHFKETTWSYLINVFIIFI